MKKRYDLPVLARLKINIDIDRLKNEYLEFSKQKNWDGLGSEYADMCKFNPELTEKFFTEQELSSVNCVCDLDWQNSSYRQISLTEYDPQYNLEQQESVASSVWRRKIAQNNTHVDERWYRKLKSDLPPYLQEILLTFNGAHRTRFAALRAGHQVKPHIDYDTTYSIRLHIAIDTNNECFNGGWDKQGNEVKAHIPADGSVWFVNPGVKHYALNNGASERTHLIISVDNQNVLDYI